MPADAERQPITWPDAFVIAFGVEPIGDAIERTRAIVGDHAWKQSMM